MIALLFCIDLQTLVDISNRFEISLDELLKEDEKMVKTIDRERVLGTVKREKTIIVGLIMIGIGWYKKEKNDREVFPSI